MTKTIAVLLFDDVEELDAVGPYEVLGAWTTYFGGDGYQLLCVSADGAAVRGAKGLGISAHCSIADAPPIDVLVHPGGSGTRRLLRDPTHLDWIRRTALDASLMTSVCTGALVYAAAGLLTGRPATTHWSAVGELADLDASISIDRTARFVDDGDVITSAGVSAGIDMALHLLTRLAGAQRCEQVRREIQYDRGA